MLLSRTRLEKRNGLATCAELIGDGANDAVELFEAEDDVMLVREVDNDNGGVTTPLLGKQTCYACAPGCELAWAWDRIGIPRNLERGLREFSSVGTVIIDDRTHRRAL
jgi:hypothetical protein